LFSGQNFGVTNDVKQPVSRAQVREERMSQFEHPLSEGGAMPSEEPAHRRDAQFAPQAGHIEYLAMSSTKDSAAAAEASRSADDVLIEGLAHGLSYSQAGDVAGVSARTVQRRMAELGFAARVAQRRDELANQLIGGLALLSTRALEVLREELDSGNRAADRIRAAGLVLAQFQRLRDAADLEARLRHLEAELTALHHASSLVPDDDEDAS
jgi:hypothetical protein